MNRRLALLIALFALFVPTPLHAELKRIKFTADIQYLVVEVLDDAPIHFEFSGVGPSPGATSHLRTSPMVFKTDYLGSLTFSNTGATIKTTEIMADVAPQSL